MLTTFVNHPTASWNTVFNWKVCELSQGLAVKGCVNQLDLYTFTCQFEFVIHEHFNKNRPSTKTNKTQTHCCFQSFASEKAVFLSCSELPCWISLTRVKSNKSKDHYFPRHTSSYRLSVYLACSRCQQASAPINSVHPFAIFSLRSRKKISRYICFDLLLIPAFLVSVRKERNWKKGTEKWCWIHLSLVPCWVIHQVNFGHKYFSPICM